MNTGMKTTAHQAKYFAHEIVCFSNNHDAGDLTGALMNAQVDLHPHQIDAALFALKHPLHEGVMLADEVGLGKTIEAGLTLCQLWRSAGGVCWWFVRHRCASNGRRSYTRNSPCPV